MKINYVELVYHVFYCYCEKFSAMVAFDKYFALTYEDTGDVEISVSCTITNTASQFEYNNLKFFMKDTEEKKAVVLLEILKKLSYAANDDTMEAVELYTKVNFNG